MYDTEVPQNSPIGNFKPFLEINRGKIITKKLVILEKVYN